MERRPLVYEDLAVGQTFHSGTLTVTEAEIVEFARQYDPQPFHTDPVAAKSTFFGGLAASGWHTVALTMRLLVTEGPPFAGGWIGAGVDEIRWPRATRPGDTLRIEAEVIGLRASASKPGQGWVKVRTTTFNQRDEVAQVLTANMIVPLRGPATNS